MTVQTFDTRALNELAKRIVKEEDRRANIILSGTADTFEDYRGQVEFLKGLRFARELCEGVESDLRKGK